MSSLQAHVAQHEFGNGGLSFRRDCPICRVERVHGRLPDATLVPPRTRAAVTAAVLATGAVAPGSVVAADGQGFAAPAPESPPPPQLSDVTVGGAAAAPADDRAGVRDEPGADRARPSDRSPRVDEPADDTASRSNTGAPPHDAPSDTSTTATVESEAVRASGGELEVEPSRSAAPGHDGDASGEPDRTPRPDRPRAHADPSPAHPETAHVSGRAGASTATGRSRTDHTAPSGVDSRRPGGSEAPARVTRDRSARGGHGAARNGSRDGEQNGVRDDGRASDGDAVELDEDATYTVRSGDSLWRIADRHLGPGASTIATAREVTRLWEINEQRIGTGDPDLIFPGQTLRL